MALYHASRKKKIPIIKPQRTLSNNKYIGDFVFATTNRKLAVMYLTPKGFPTLMNPSEKNANIVICAQEKEFIEYDQGGAIYELPVESFNPSPQKGLSEYEMVSQQPVRPLNEVDFNSAITALISAGVTIRFTDEATFKTLIRHPRQEEMIKNLNRYEP